MFRARILIDVKAREGLAGFLPALRDRRATICVNQAKGCLVGLAQAGLTVARARNFMATKSQISNSDANFE